MRQSYFLITLHFLGLTLGFTSCQEVPNDGLPSYIKINQVSFFNEDGVIDTLSGIYDVWVQVEGDDRGAIGWPNTIAVLTEGEKLILLEPGIYKNGDFLQREVYPFYDIVQIDTTLTLYDTLVLNPVFTYAQGIQFSLRETFEVSNNFSNLNAESPPIPLSGKAGVIHLNSSLTNAECAMLSAVGLPSGQRIFLEMHYSSTNDFAIGLRGEENGTVLADAFVYYAPPTQDGRWEKLYLDVSNDIGQIDAESYRFYIQTSLYPDLDNSFIAVDNVKLVHF